MAEKTNLDNWAGQARTNLDKWLYLVRRIEEHREEDAVKKLKRLYKGLIKDLRKSMGDVYADHADPETGALSYAELHRLGLDARLLEEVASRMNDVTQEEKRIITETVEQTYSNCYSGMVQAVEKTVDNDELRAAFSTVEAVKPEVLRAAVNNPVHGLTLSDQLEKNRADIIYSIKQAVGVGLSQGDRYDTMARRIQQTLIGPDGAGGSYYKAVRIARTEAHRVREEGNLDAAQNLTEQLEPAGITMVKTWHTMKDERVRPNKARKTKGGWKYSKGGKYDHVSMEGVQVGINEEFKLPSGATTQAPGKSGVAGEDINCRCFLSYDVVKNVTPKMATGETDNDWSKALPLNVSPEQKTQIIMYAKSKGVNLDELSQFDGDPILLVHQIDALSDLQKKYPLRRKITLAVRDLDDEDFGKKSNRTLCVNKKALRNAKITEENIGKGNRFASEHPKDIAIHEYGHFIEEQYGRIKLDKIRQALYNISGETKTDEEIIDYLAENISRYSVHSEMKSNGMSYFTDIGSEILVVHENASTPFTHELIRLWIGGK